MKVVYERIHDVCMRIYVYILCICEFNVCVYMQVSMYIYILR